jgi:hypothetical protein
MNWWRNYVMTLLNKLGNVLTSQLLFNYLKTVRQKKSNENKHVSFFSVLLWNIFCSDKYLGSSYSQIRTHAHAHTHARTHARARARGCTRTHTHTHIYKYSIHHNCCPILTKTRMYLQISVQWYQIVLKSIQQISGGYMQTDKLYWFVNVLDKILWISSIFIICASSSLHRHTQLAFCHILPLMLKTVS